MNTQWDLSVLYSSHTDLQLELDKAKLFDLINSFIKYRNNLNSQLANALLDYEDITFLSNKINCYLYLLQSTNLNDKDVKSLIDKLQTEMSEQFIKISFFDIELSKLSDDDVNSQLNNETVKFYIPFIKEIRKDNKFFLSEEVEQALVLRSKYGTSSWVKYYNELIKEIKVSHKKNKLSVTEALHISTNSPDEEERYCVMKKLNNQFKKNFAKFSAETLNNIIGAKKIETKSRGYSYPMHSTNLHNKLSKETVDALHKAVSTKGAELANRFYKLKAKILNKKKLRWSDRNVSFGSLNKTYSYEDSINIILKCYHSFNKTLGEKAQEVVDNNWIDVYPSDTKRGGAYSYSFNIDKDKTISFIMLNHIGSSRDLFTIAHELGHSIHGLLSGKQKLMAEVPMAYAETASVFGERLVFTEIMKTLPDDEKFALLMSKIDDTLNTTLRQIGFSNFEQRIHNSDKLLSVDDYCKIWIEETKKLYGDIFNYSGTEYLWTYISHFHRPFYVYAYAVGELLTSSLFAVKDNVENFEEKYVELLKSGGSRTLTEMLEPFGLDPEKPDFWNKGLETIEKMINEAEDIFNRNPVI